MKKRTRTARRKADTERRDSAITVRIPDHMLAALDAMAKRARRPRADFIRIALEDLVAKGASL